MGVLRQSAARCSGVCYRTFSRLSKPAQQPHRHHLHPYTYPSVTTQWQRQWGRSFTAPTLATAQMDRDEGYRQFPTDDFLDNFDFGDPEDDDDYDEKVKDKRKEIQHFETNMRDFKELFRSLDDASTPLEYLDRKTRIDRFEERHFPVSAEEKVIDWLMSKVRASAGKDRFMLLMKAQRALHQKELKDAFDPDNPSHFKILKRYDPTAPQLVDEDEEDSIPDASSSSSRRKRKDATDGEDSEEDEKEEDAVNEEIARLDTEIKKKLAAMEVSLGKELRELEKEAKELVHQREVLMNKGNEPKGRRGFHGRLIHIKRTSKATKGGRVASFSAIAACGNYNGVVGYAKAKADSVPIAAQKAHERCYKRLQFVERYCEHTLPHAMQIKFKKTKLYLWPAPVNVGLRANKYIAPILKLAGYKNVRSKVIGSRNPYNTIKALFMALESIETPQDIQQKFGRTVVESYLLKQ